MPGDLAFKLHDTYGFPLDLTNDVCRERGVTVDEDGFKAAMDRQKAQARAAGKFKMDKALEYGGEANRFSGYDGLTESAKIVAIYVDGTSAQALEAGQNGVVVLDNTPFYAESGGQVGDQGVIHAGGARFAVDDTLKIRADVYGHHGRLSPARCAWAMPCRPRSMPRCAPRPCATIRSRTSCTRPCAKCWAATCSRRARW